MVKEFFKKMFLGADSQTQPRSIVIHSQGIGSTGTDSYAGYPQEEYLHTLQGTQRAKLFDKMRRSDPQVNMLLNATKTPIQSAMWKVEPGKTGDVVEPWAEEDAKLVEWVLFHGMKKSFPQFVKEALTILEHGHAVFEIIDKATLYHPDFGSINTIEDLAFRSQKTIERWNLNPKTDELLSITQVANGDLTRYVDIPAEFLCVLSMNREGSNYEGISTLRCIYGNWFRKNQYLKLNAIGIEKFAIPTPLAEVPSGQESSEQYTNLVSALERYVGHERNYLTYPAGWKVDLKTNTYDPQKVEVSIDNEDKRMTKAYMANFLELGMNGFGSQSLSFDLSDFFLGSIEHVAAIVSEALNRVIIPRIIQMNRGPRSVYPRMCVSGISDRAGKEFAEIVDGMVEKGVIKCDDKLEAHMRERYNLPLADPTTAREALVAAPKFAERVKGLLRG